MNGIGNQVKNGSHGCPITMKIIHQIEEKKLCFIFVNKIHKYRYFYNKKRKNTKFNAEIADLYHDVDQK